MGIPLLQKLFVGSYVIRQRLTGRKRYPLVLMLEPLFRCNLACAGCGKIDYPDPILHQNMSVEDALRAYVEATSYGRYSGRKDLRFKTWRMRDGEWFEGCYVFETTAAQRIASITLWGLVSVPSDMLTPAARYRPKDSMATPRRANTHTACATVAPASAMSCTSPAG